MKRNILLKRHWMETLDPGTAVRVGQHTVEVAGYLAEGEYAHIQNIPILGSLFFLEPDQGSLLIGESVPLSCLSYIWPMS